MTISLAIFAISFCAFVSGQGLGEQQQFFAHNQQQQDFQTVQLPLQQRPYPPRPYGYSPFNGDVAAGPQPHDYGGSPAQAPYNGLRAVLSPAPSRAFAESSFAAGVQQFHNPSADQFQVVQPGTALQQSSAFFSPSSACQREAIEQCGALYMDCLNNHRVVSQCERDKVFDSRFLSCVDASQCGLRQPRFTLAQPRIQYAYDQCQSNELIPQGYCSPEFTRCSQGAPVYSTCDNGLVFDYDRSECCQPQLAGCNARQSCDDGYIPLDDGSCGYFDAPYEFDCYFDGGGIQQCEPQPCYAQRSPSSSCNSFLYEGYRNNVPRFLPSRGYPYVYGRGKGGYRYGYGYGYGDDDVPLILNSDIDGGGSNGGTTTTGGAAGPAVLICENQKKADSEGVEDDALANRVISCKPADQATANEERGFYAVRLNSGNYLNLGDVNGRSSFGGFGGLGGSGIFEDRSFFQLPTRRYYAFGAPSFFRRNVGNQIRLVQNRGRNFDQILDSINPSLRNGNIVFRLSNSRRPLRRRVWKRSIQIQENSE